MIEPNPADGIKKVQPEITTININEPFLINDTDKTTAYEPLSIFMYVEGPD